MTVQPDSREPDMRSDIELLQALARHLRKHDVGCFDYVTGEQDRAEVLIAWFAESVEVFNVPPRVASDGL